MNERAEQIWIRGRESVTELRRRGVGVLIGVDVERKHRMVNTRIKRYAAAAGKLAVMRLDPDRNPDFKYEAAWKNWLEAEDSRRRDAYVRGLTAAGDYSRELREDFDNELGEGLRTVRMAYDHPDGYWLDSMGSLEDRDRREYLADLIDDVTFQEVVILSSRLRRQSTESLDTESR